LEVGGKGKRGGLLLEVPGRDSNFLQVLTCLELEESTEESDGICLDVLMQLQGLNLLRKEDIKKFDLLLHSSTTSGDYTTPPFFNRHRFEFLLDWDPQALTYQYNDGRSFLHSVLNNNSE